MKPRRVFASLALGLVCTILAAWVGVLAVTTRPPWADPNTFEFLTWIGENYRIPQVRRPAPQGEVFIDWFGWAALDRVTIVPSWGPNVPPEYVTEWRTYYPLAGDIPAQTRSLYKSPDRPLPTWARVPDEHWAPRGVTTYAAGWPWPALSAWEEHHPPNPARVLRTMHDAWVIARVPSVATRWLPLRPMWPGLIADTLFYATLIMASASGASCFRGCRRRQRGLCPACGYDVRATPAGAPCPECGVGPAAPHSGHDAQPSRPARG
jgi:hypothetical protein